MRRNLFLEQLNPRGKRSAPLIKRACHPIITFTLTRRQLISSSDYSTVAGRRFLLLYSSEPISFASPWETLWDMLHPSTWRSCVEEKDPVYTFSMGWSCFFTTAVSHLQKKNVPALTLALLALVLPLPLFLSNSFHSSPAA